MKWFVMDEEKEEAGSQAGVCPVSRRWVYGAKPDLAQKGTHIGVAFTRTWTNNIASTEWLIRLIHRQVED